MLVLVTYDVNTEDASGRSRLRRVAKVCTNHGIRVQKSVFECEISPSDRVLMEAELRGIMDETSDSIRIYDLGSLQSSKITHLGVNRPLDLDGTLMF